MLTTGIARRRQRDDHVGANHANQPDVVGGDLLAPPFLERLLDAEREAEVDGSSEVLLGAVEPVHGSKLLRAEHAERFENLGSDFVLAAVAAGGGGERGPIALPAVQHHQQSVVLVVGVRRGVKEDTGVGQVPQRQAEGHVALRVVERHHPHLRARERCQSGQDNDG